MAVHEGRAVLLGERAGFYELRDDAGDDGAKPVAFAANLLDAEESAIAPQDALVVDGKGAGRDRRLPRRRAPRDLDLPAAGRGPPDGAGVGHLPPQGDGMTTFSAIAALVSRWWARLARRGFAALALGVFAVGLWAYLRYVWYAGPTLTWAHRTGEYELLAPRMLGIALLAPYFLWVIGRSLADLPAAQRALSVALRIAFVGDARARPGAPGADGDDAGRCAPCTSST